MEFALALLYLRFAFWRVDLNLLSGPDAFKRPRSTIPYYVISFQYAKKRRYLKTFLKISRGPLKFAFAGGTVVESDRRFYFFEAQEYDAFESVRKMVFLLKGRPFWPCMILIAYCTWSERNGTPIKGQLRFVLLPLPIKVCLLFIACITFFAC